jgi:glycosyltransferase involved in cell wall biosynthesis
MWEQTVLPRLVKKLDLDILHAPMHVLPVICPCQSVVSILDLAFIRYPNAFPRSQRMYLETFTRRSAHKTDAIIAISESTKRDVVELLGVSGDKVFVTPLAADPKYQPVTEERTAEIREIYGFGHLNAVYVGTLEPRKNILALLKAFDKARKSLTDDCKLVLAGGKGWYYDEVFALVKELGLESCVIFTGYVPAEDLPALYSAADVFVYPSLYEGFGLPPLEAMACGAPVITSNTSSLPEVVGDAGITVDPNDTGALADSIKTVLSDESLRREMSVKGLKRSTEFSWKHTAQLTFDIYRHVYSGGAKL